MNPFQKASRSQVFLKLAITGPTGSGKTFSALCLAAGLLDEGQRIAFSDTENESASLYSDLTEKQCRDMKIPANEITDVMATSRLFDAAPIAPPYAPEDFLSHVQMAVANGYGALVMDSASHFWKGILAFKDQLDGHGGTNKFTNWKVADGKFDPVIEAVLQSKIHVIFCMRSKMAFEVDESSRKVKKLGLAPIMRENLEYEFTTVFDVGMDHSAMASKDRSGMFPTDRVFTITKDTGREFRDWLKTATPKPPTPQEIAEKSKAIDAYRGELELTRAAHAPDVFARAYCAVMSKRLAHAEPRLTLDGFTYAELRKLWDQRIPMATDAVLMLSEGGEK